MSFFFELFTKLFDRHPRGQEGLRFEDFPLALQSLARDVLSEKRVREAFLDLATAEPHRRREILEGWLAGLQRFSREELDRIVDRLSSAEDFAALGELAVLLVRQDHQSGVSDEDTLFSPKQAS